MELNNDAMWSLVLLLVRSKCDCVPPRLFIRNFAITVFIRLTTHLICPEMHANEIHELYDRHHKVSPNLNSH